MKAIAFLIAVFLGPVAALGENRIPASQAAHPKPKVIDLDFSEEEPAQATVASASGTLRPWIFWTMGAAAAAGGIGWYLFEEAGRGSGTTRSEQVFTDDRQ